MPESKIKIRKKLAMVIENPERFGNQTKTGTEYLNTCIHSRLISEAVFLL